MRIEKKQIVSDIASMIGDSAYVFVVSYKGLNVKDFSQLRDDLAKLDSRCNVLKNRLIEKAAEIQGEKALLEVELSGDTALVTGNGDPGAVAKALNSFSKGHDQVQFKGGSLEGATLKPDDVDMIANLPSREVLLAQVLGLLQAPTRNLVSVLNNAASGIVNVLSAYQHKLEEGESA